MMVDTTCELDLDVFDEDKRQFVENYLKTKCDFGHVEVYNGMLGIQKAYQAMLNGMAIMDKRFGLTYDFEGDSGIESYAAHEYAKYLSEEGFVTYRDRGGSNNCFTIGISN